MLSRLKLEVFESHPNWVSNICTLFVRERERETELEKERHREKERHTHRESLFCSPFATNPHFSNNFKNFLSNQLKASFAYIGSQRKLKRDPLLVQNQN